MFGLVVLVLALACRPAAAQAAFPGANGKIAYATSIYPPTSQIYTVNPDGSGQTPLAQGTEPAWSADGRKLVYLNAAKHIATTNADGSGQTDLGIGPMVGEINSFLSDPSWSPDGSQILYAELIEYPDSSEQSAMWIVNADGSGKHMLLWNPPYGDGHDPVWSPDGRWIAFSGQCGGDPSGWRLDICKVHPDGTGVTSLFGGTEDDSVNSDWSPYDPEIVFRYLGAIRTVETDGTSPAVVLSGGNFSAPAFSPDGHKIVFASSPGSPEPTTVNVMNADGTGATPLTPGLEPSWQPIPYKGYPRPKGATPVQVPLVPAYEECISSNTTHGPPLSYPSCAPPAQASPNLTVGTPDANGEASNSVGSVRMRVFFCPQCASPVGEDVFFDVSLTDVRNAGDLSDYEGELEARSIVRITDKANGPATDEPGTVQDLDFAFGVPCAKTDDAGVGARCAVDTSLQALSPGAVQQGKRAIWQLGALRIYDGGPDGVASTAGNSLFATQGLFIP